MIYKGSCHCSGIIFEIEAPEVLNVEECNCSMCKKSGFLHLIRPLSSFKILKGKELITTYSFNSHTAKHTFCKVCGIKPFYTPRSNPDGIDINVRCLDTEPKEVLISKFDGQNWEQNAHTLIHKSQATV